VLNPITYNNIFDLLCYKISWFIYLCTEVTLAYKKSKSVFPKRWSIAALLASLAYLIAQPPISWGMQIYFQASIDILMVSMPLLHMNMNMNMNSYIVHNVIINNIYYYYYYYYFHLHYTIVLEGCVHKHTRCQNTPEVVGLAITNFDNTVHDKQWFLFWKICQKKLSSRVAD
jgi:hypothetical protein